MVAATALLVGLWMTRGVASPLGGSTSRVITVEASQWQYSPGIITVHEGDRVTLRLKTDDVTHGFYLDGYGITTAVLPHETTELHFVASRPGRWMFRCSVTCGPFHPYMIGWLRVQPNTTLRWGWVAVGAISLAALYAAWEEGRGR
jgi:heme/copper-type cytochrome/quinol oxidase subunit 2